MGAIFGKAEAVGARLASKAVVTHAAAQNISLVSA